MPNNEGDGFYPADFQDPSETEPQGPLDAIKNGIKLWGDVGLTIGTNIDKQTEMMSRWQRHMDQLQRGTPVYYNTAKHGIVDASGDPLALQLGKPDQGTRWEVKGVRVGGADFNVTAAGTAGLYVAAYHQQGVAPGLLNARDVALSLPNVGFYGSEQMIVNEQESVFVVIYGGTVGQVYIANISATVLNVGSAGGKVTETI